MRSTLRRTGLAAALAGIAVAATIAAPATYATAADPASPAATCDASHVPPPPSSIAASAEKGYAVLRGAWGRDCGMTVASAPLADEPSTPSGFDWVSATIGAVAAAGLSLVALALLGMPRAARRRPARAAD